MFCMQIEVPKWKYGDCEWFLPDEMRGWLKNLGLKYSYGGYSLSGNGVDETTGRSTVYYTCMVWNCKAEDATAFGIQFPECKLYVSEQYEHA